MLLPFDLTPEQTEQLVSAWRKVFGRQKCNIVITDYFHDTSSPEYRINDIIAFWYKHGQWHIACFKQDPHMYHICDVDRHIVASKSTWIETVASIIALNSELKVLNYLFDGKNNEKATPGELLHFLHPPPYTRAPIKPFQFIFIPTKSNKIFGEELTSLLDEHGLNVFSTFNKPPSTIGVSIEADKYSTAEAFILNVLRTAGISGSLQQYTQP